MNKLDMVEELREAALNILSALVNEYPEGVSLRVMEAHKALERAYDATAPERLAQLNSGEWVSVEDRLPEKGVEVLGALRGCDSGRYRFSEVVHVDADDHTWESEGSEIANCWDVTHWTIPQPPEQKQ